MIEDRDLVKFLSVAAQYVNSKVDVNKLYLRYVPNGEIRVAKVVIDNGDLEFYLQNGLIIVDEVPKYKPRVVFHTSSKVLRNILVGNIDFIQAVLFDLVKPEGEHSLEDLCIIKNMFDDIKDVYMEIVKT